MGDKSAIEWTDATWNPVTGCTKVSAGVMTTFTPLKITAYPETGVISDRFLPIDSILHSQVMRERFGPQEVTIPLSHLNPLDIQYGEREMPLRKLRDHQARKWRIWYYAASFAVWPEHTVEAHDYWTKRFDSRLIALLEERKMPRLNTSSGRYRGYRMPVFYRVALEVSWYVVGDKERIETLLGSVTHLGKKRSQGFGSVREWRVEPWPHDWSVRGPKGEVMRAIPATNGGGLLFGLRPSYWLPKNQVPCLLPGDDRA